jgi:CheY-like chemotaxis protein
MRASQMLGVSEIDLLGLLAKKLQYQVLPDLQGLQLHAPMGMHAQELLSRGLFYFGNKGVLTGVACVDPQMVSAELGVAIYLSPWSEIAKAYRRHSTPEHQSTGVIPSETTQRSLALKAISEVIAEVEGFGLCSCTFFEENHALYYSFTNAEGRRAVGEVAAHIQEAVKQQLLPLSRGNSHLSRLNGEPLYVEGVECGLSAFKVAFRWKAPQAVRATAIRSQEDLAQKADGVISPIQFSPALVPIEPPMPPTIQKPTALLIDDNETFGKILERYLARYEINVERVQNAEAGLVRLKSGVYRDLLVVCDVHMPGMNGAEFVTQLRALPGLDQVQVVMLTSDDDIETKIGLLEQGADLFINKNEDPRVLGIHVQKFLAKCKSRQAA